MYSFCPYCDQITGKSNLVRIYLGSWFEGIQSIVAKKAEQYGCETVGHIALFGK